MNTQEDNEHPTRVVKPITMRPEALTFALMIVCERLVLSRHAVLVSAFIGPLQFAHRRKKNMSIQYIQYNAIMCLA